MSFESRIQCSLNMVMETASRRISLVYELVIASSVVYWN